MPGMNERTNQSRRIGRWRWSWPIALLAAAGLVLAAACGGDAAEEPAVPDPTHEEGGNGHDDAGGHEEAANGHDDADGHEEAANGHGDADAGEATEVTYLADAHVDERLTVRMVDYAFEPEEITVRAGEIVEIEFVNDGVMEHDFSISHMQADVLTMGQHHGDDAHGHSDDGHGHGDDDAMHVHLDPGESAVVRVKIHESGEFEFVCVVEGHRELGQVGVLRVES